MILIRPTTSDRLARHWFWLAFPVLLAVSFSLARWPIWLDQGAAAEAVLLVDWCVIVPALYALCYRRRFALPHLLLRMLALACFGTWLMSWLLPEDAQRIGPQLTWVRWTGIAVLVLVELRLVAAAIRIAFSGKGSADDIARASGAPPWIARLMLLEARFWRAVWGFLRGR